MARAPMACAHRMSRGVSPMTYVRSSGGSAPVSVRISARARWAIAGRSGAPSENAPQKMQADEASVRNRVLNEVLDAFSELDDNAGIEGIVKVIQNLKKRNRAAAEEKA